MLHKNNKIKFIAKYMFLVLLFALSINAFAVWTDPMLPPVAGNIKPPLNTSAAGQQKDGPLIVNGFRSFAQGIFDANLSVLGNTTIGGTLTISGGSPGANKVLTSNASGVASWQPATSGGAPTDATYITQTSNSNLSAEQSLGSLGTGILRNVTTSGAGVLSIAVAGDFPILNQNTTGNAATATSLAANPNDCSSGSYARGIDANGVAEGCTAVISGVTDHGALTGLTDDDHPQYALLAGRGFGQTLIGGHSTATGVLTLVGGAFASADLNLKTTSAVGVAGADMHFLVGNNGGTEAMTILNNGNVGIGDTSPSAKLEITGASDSSGIRFTNLTSSSPAGSATTKVLSVNGSGDVVLVTDNTGSGGITNLNGLTATTQGFSTGTAGNDFNIDSTTSPTHVFNIPNASLTARGVLSISAQTIGGVKTFSNTTAGISHNIGVVSNADSFINLNSTATSGRSWSLISVGTSGIGAGKFSIYDSTAGASRLTINSSGNVGIGTTAPGYKFDVAGQSNFTADNIAGGTALRIISNGSGSTGQTGISATVTGANTSTNQDTSAGYFENSHTIPSGFTSKNRGITAIAAGGGLGTSTNIAGRFAATGGTNNYAIIVEANEGSVGIGTSTPTALLDVAGTAKVGGVQYVPVAGKPTCSATNRGLTWFTPSAAGVKDLFEVCARDAGNVYAWRLLY